MPVAPSGTPQVVDSLDLEAVGAVREQAGPFMELGTTGLKRSSGYVDEEFLPALKGKKAIQVYREMGDNDPIVGALLFAIVQLIRNVDWPVVPAGKDRDSNNAAKLVETCMDDMSHAWDDMIAEIVWGSLQYGWQWNEIVMKRRMSPWARDGRQRSKYTDGLYGWRKIPIRAQETLQRWIFDETGGVQGMLQLAPPDYKTRYLPIERSLLFRYGTHKGNPEGRSLLRNAYRPWFYKKRMEEFESVGVERDLAGLPMVELPSDYLKAKPGTEERKMADSLQRMVRAIRRNEQEGLLFPLDYDRDTNNQRFRFSLLGSGGARQFSTNELIQRYEQRILMTVLADWIMVGHTDTGTYNMHLDKRAAMRTALNAIAKSIADVFNRHAIPRLFAANGWKPAELPTIRPSDVDAPDLTQLGGFLAQTAGLGFNWFDADMDAFLRNSAGLPELADDAERRVGQLAQRREGTMLAQAQTEYLAARSALAQQMAQDEMMRRGEPSPEHAAMMAAGSAGAAQQDGQDAQAAAQQQQAGEQHADQMATNSLQRVSQWAQLFGGQSGPGGGSKNGSR